MYRTIAMTPIGVVRTSRTEPTDDYWGGNESTIELDADRFSSDSLSELETFSHIEVVFVFHLFDADDVELRARRPRGRADWPLVGVFAQRNKHRPNRIGISRARILDVAGTRIRVEGLDAVDNTPVLDVKPYIAEFGPRGEVRQPGWASELMHAYFAPAHEKS